MQPAETLMETQNRTTIHRQIIHLAWPVIGEQLLSYLANTVDTVLIGHLDTLSMAAMGFALLPYWLGVGLFVGLGIGVNALVARFYGAGEHEQIEPATRAGFWLGAVVAVVAAGLMAGFAPQIVTLAGAEPDVVPVAARVLRLLVPGMVVQFWTMVMTAALRATGDTRTSLGINVGINLLNAPLAYLLIYGGFGVQGLGVYGAGYATTAARILGGLVLLVILLRRGYGARLEWRRLSQLDFSLLRRIVRVGAVSSTERMFSTAIYLIYSVMVATLGTAAVAAQNIAVAAEYITWTLASGFAMATAALVGQRLGAQRPDQADAVIRAATTMCAVALGLVGLLFIIVPGPYIAMFTGDPATRELSSAALRIAGYTEICTAIVLTLNGALSGAGDTRPLFLVTVGGGMVRLAFAALFLLGFGWGLEGAWVAAALDWVVRMAVIVWRYRSGAWKTVKV